MKVGFIIPVLNAAEHLAGLLAQINDCGKTVVVDFTDTTVDDLDSNNGRSHDNSYKISEAFDGVDFVSMGKVKDRRCAMNKGLSMLEGAEYIIMLQQGDFILDIQYILDELQSNDIVSTRRLKYWDNFGQYFLGEREEIAFRNIRHFGELRYVNDPYSISSPNGHALKEHNVLASCIDNVIANFKMITSQEKRKRMMVRDMKEKMYFANRNVDIRTLQFEDVKKYAVKDIDESVSFLNLVPHPWRNEEESFFDDLPTFPYVEVDKWRECFDGEYSSAFGDILEFERPKVLGIGNHYLASYFEAEGWEYHFDPDDEFDLIFSIGSIPDINLISTFLKSNGQMIIMNAEELTKCPGYEVVFLKEEDKLLSYSLMKGNQDG